MIKNKRGWLRIVEAFMAVIIVLGAVLVINQRTQTPASTNEEITLLERNILDFVRQDAALRAEVLSGKLSGVDKIMNVTIPAGYSYAIINCTVNASVSQLCVFEGLPYIEGVISAEDTLIVANLTYFNPDQARKIKLFVWRGGWPSGVARPDYG